MANYELDPSFPHRYRASVLAERPGRQDAVRYYPGGKLDGGHDGLIVSVAPDGAPAWVGIFPGESKGPETWPVGIFSCPNSDEICVVNKGRAYIVNAFAPDRSTSNVGVTPVCFVRPLPEQNMLLFGDFIQLSARGPSGEFWRSDRLVWDDLAIARISGNELFGNGFGGIVGKTSAFRLNLATGKAVPEPTIWRRPWKTVAAIITVIALGVLAIRLIAAHYGAQPPTQKLIIEGHQ